MSCTNYLNDLTAYLDGELDARRARKMESHLAECAGCAAEYRQSRAGDEFVIAHAATLESGPELWNNLRARIAALPEPLGSRGLFDLWFGRRWLAAAAGVAAAAVMTAGLWGYLSYRESQRALERYMWQYVQERESELALTSFNAAMRRSPGSRDMDGITLMENPFSITQPVAFDNPFRSGER